MYKTDHCAISDLVASFAGHPSGPPHSNLPCDHQLQEMAMGGLSLLVQLQDLLITSGFGGHKKSGPMLYSLLQQKASTQGFRTSEVDIVF